MRRANHNGSKVRPDVARSCEVAGGGACTEEACPREDRLSEPALPVELEGALTEALLAIAVVAEHAGPRRLASQKAFPEREAEELVAGRVEASPACWAVLVV